MRSFAMEKLFGAYHYDLPFCLFLPFTRYLWKLHTRTTHIFRVYKFAISAVDRRARIGFCFILIKAPQVWGGLGMYGTFQRAPFHHRSGSGFYYFITLRIDNGWIECVCSLRKSTSPGSRNEFRWENADRVGILLLFMFLVPSEAIEGRFFFFSFSIPATIFVGAHFHQRLNNGAVLLVTRHANRFQMLFRIVERSSVTSMN